MKPLRFDLLISIIILYFCTIPSIAGDHPVNPEKTIEKVKDAMLSMQRRAWEQGTGAQALLELGEKDLVILFAKDAVVNQLKDGRLGLNDQGRAVTDPASNGEPVLFAARMTKDPKLKKAATDMLDYLLYKAPKTRDGIIYHMHIENRIWVDSFYMMPPFLAVMGHPEEAVKQILGYRNRLLDKKTGLYRHMWDEDTQSFNRDALWGTGNGWAAAGMVRVIRALPESMQKEKDMLVQFTKEVIDACLKYQRSDGLFHDVLDDPTTFEEINIGQMLAYSIYRGVDDGWMDASYLTHADKMRKVAYAHVDEFGLIQKVCGAPHFNRQGTSVEAQAFFLLMEAAYRDLHSSKN